MRLYSGPISLFTAKVRIALAEKGIDYERIEVGYSIQDAYQPHHPDVDRLNPHGQVPILVDGDLVVYDSTLILEYLEERYPERALFPRDLQQRARCRQFEAYADEVVFPHVWTLIEGLFYASPGSPPDLARIEQARAGLDACYEFLDGALRGSDHLCRDFSVADIGNYVIASAAALLSAPVPEHLGNLRAWQDRVGERATVNAEVAAMNEFVAKSSQTAAAAEA